MTGRIGKLVAVCLAALVTSVGVAAATGVDISVTPKKNNAAVRLCLNLKSGTLRQLTAKTKGCRTGERMIVITKGAAQKSAAGLQGPQGPKGAAGANGANGANGTNGAQGAEGPQGASGEQGAQGSQGPQGLQGEQGPQGISGVLGVSAIAAKSDDSSSPCVLGGWTISTTAGDIDVCNGPQGANGENGANGANGQDGAPGLQGPKGDNGANG
jgi:hypothetical protein